VEGADQSAVAAIGQLRDDQAAGVAEVLVAVFDGGVCDSDAAVVVLPVVSELGEPAEVVLVVDIFVDHFHDNIASMDVDDNQGSQRDSCHHS